MRGEPLRISAPRLQGRLRIPYPAPHLRLRSREEAPGVAARSAMRERGLSATPSFAADRKAKPRLRLPTRRRRPQAYPRGGEAQAVCHPKTVWHPCTVRAVPFHRLPPRFCTPPRFHRRKYGCLSLFVCILAVLYRPFLNLRRQKRHRLFRLPKPQARLKEVRAPCAEKPGRKSQGRRALPCSSVAAPPRHQPRCSVKERPRLRICPARRQIFRARGEGQA